MVDNETTDTIFPKHSQNKKELTSTASRLSRPKSFWKSDESLTYAESTFSNAFTTSTTRSVTCEVVQT